MSTVFSGTLFNSFKKTLDKVINDKELGDNRVMAKFCEQGEMEDAYHDDLEMGGLGLPSEKVEGGEIPLTSLREGVMTRYIARTFALGFVITEEALDDCKYSEVIDAAKRLNRSMDHAENFDATNMLVRATNSAYVGGDGQPLASTAHTIPGGGTFSNIMAVALAPSTAACIAAATQVAKYPGHDGLPSSYNIKKVVCPVDQRFAWSVLTKSAKAPEAGEFNAINVVKDDMDIEAVPNIYWNTTTTNYTFLTDVPKGTGLRFRWRKKPKSRSWVENSNMVMKYSISARWARGWSDPRCILFVNA